MDGSVLQRIRESIAQKRQNLADWLSEAPPEVLQIHTGSAGGQAVREHLRTLDNALQKAEENTLGICEVCNDFVDASRLEMDYTASVCIEHLTGEERTLLENELELSQKVQKALLPHHIPRLRGLQIAAFSQPAHIVGGDYFDFVRMKDGAHAIVIADVMGKGMPASMLMASLQASLHIIAPESTGPVEVVNRLNHLFCHNIRLTKFVTFFLGRYDEQSQTLTYCNAGHNPPLLISKEGSIRKLNPTGAAIGLLENAEFSSSSVSLQSGDRVLLYTDGVVELFNEQKQLFGEDRLEKFLHSSRTFQPDQLLSSLRSQLLEFSRTPSPSDDTTIIAIGVE